MKNNTKMEEILNAALYLFGTKGYLKTSMTDICEAVKLTKGGLYHYLYKKEDALVMMHDRMCASFEKAFRESSKPTDSPNVKLACWIKVHAMLMKEYQLNIKIFFTELDHLKNSEHYEEIIARRDKISNMLYEILNEGRNQKIFRVDIHPRVLTFLIMGMINWFYQWYHPDGPLSIGIITEEIQSLVFSGVTHSHEIDNKV